MFDIIDSVIDVFVDVVVVVNFMVENIGVWWLQIVMEWVFDEILFMVFDCSGEMVQVDVDFVQKYVGDFVKNVDLSWFIL